MPAVLTAASTLLCPHGFPFQVRPGHRLFTVDGSFVVVRGDLLATAIASCVNTVPCKQVTSITAGLSTTFAIDGDPVVLATATGTTNVAPGWRVQLVNQRKLEAA